jgi:hypothetical protein
MLVKLVATSTSLFVKVLPTSLLPPSVSCSLALRVSWLPVAAKLAEKSTRVDCWLPPPMGETQRMPPVLTPGPHGRRAASVGTAPQPLVATAAMPGWLIR